MNACPQAVPATNTSKMNVVPAAPLALQGEAR
jgi:hypothetical protein